MTANSITLDRITDIDQQQTDRLDLRQPYIEFEGVNLVIDKESVLRDIKFKVPRNQITAIIGPSGSGKSSLLNTITRLTDMIPATHLQGKICIEGEDIVADSTDLLKLRRDIGMIFQKPTPFPFSIQKNFELPLKEIGIRGKKEIIERMEQALYDVGLLDELNGRFDKPAQSLSGGQQQRLCIARALCLKPKALIMDEPCSALDPHSTQTIEHLMLRLKERHTLLVVTHNLAQARRVSDYCGVLWKVENAGQLIEAAPTRVLFENPRHKLTRDYIYGLQG
ncbi:MAG: phosphate ABC transporter ATP-binding protein [Gammaproteobacteria bacterium]|nr:phosphate ABC transporter ATP-binding protein [Gammaproteobacteria bacterium]MDH5693352.1 phosphate ABC transporter ATP-binding protein [Gammaproteobacteria bacterium]